MAMTEPTELESAVKQAIKENIKIGAHPWPEIAQWSLEAAARAAIAELTKAGWVVVPIEPTEKMLDAAYYEEAPSWSAEEDCNLQIRECGIGIPQKVWGAMIAAAPKP